MRSKNNLYKEPWDEDPKPDKGPCIITQELREQQKNHEIQEQVDFRIPMWQRGKGPPYIVTITIINIQVYNLVRKPTMDVGVNYELHYEKLSSYH